MRKTELSRHLDRLVVDLAELRARSPELLDRLDQYQRVAGLGARSFEAIGRSGTGVEESSPVERGALGYDAVADARRRYEAGVVEAARLAREMHVLCEVVRRARAQRSSSSPGPSRSTSAPPPAA